MAWAKIPTQWIVHAQRLPELSWREYKSDATASLILLMALSIELNLCNRRRETTQTGNPTALSKTYDELQTVTGLSRAKISAGISLLRELGIVQVTKSENRNVYALPSVGIPGEWAQLPQSRILVSGELRPFSRYLLRARNELNALKLYFVVLAYRNNRSNLASVGYDKICEVSGMARNDIAPARSLLINDDLIRLSQSDMERDGEGHPHNRYYIMGLDRTDGGSRRGLPRSMQGVVTPQARG
jgi:hypothetical protein